jgi:hypothetical protein
VSISVHNLASLLVNVKNEGEKDDFFLSLRTTILHKEAQSHIIFCILLTNLQKFEEEEKQVLLQSESKNDFCINDYET